MIKWGSRFVRTGAAVFGTVSLLGSLASVAVAQEPPRPHDGTTGIATSGSPTSGVSPSSASTSFCLGCVDALPAPDLDDAIAVAVSAVYLNVPCPDPGLCDASFGQQIDAVVVDLQTDANGMIDPGGEMDDFALVLPGGGQAEVDSVSCDSSVFDAICGLGPEAPNTAFAAIIYYDAPFGSSWTQVNFGYYSFLGDAVYTFT